MTFNAGSIHRGWIDAINARNWDDAVQSLSPTITVNDRNLDRATFIDTLRSYFNVVPDDVIYVDLIMVDKSNAKVVARNIHHGTLAQPYHGAQVTGNPIEWSEHTFYYFNDQGKVEKLVSLLDTQAFATQTREVPRTPPSDRVPPENSSVDMEAVYRAYIDSINSRTMAEYFPGYCQSNIVHNCNKYTTDQYREMIESSQVVIEDLWFGLEDVIVDESAQMVASHIRFTGKPVKEFCGIQPTGREVRFSELCIYQLQRGKICFVWSLLDLEAYERSMA
ncbi:hypothetical protein S40285_08386 [Stachybotrys chlorohalonatus IBT 40285]|uniref:SnoaL-like domain-containing protein n=1 Tax=Stachybotrys chlorohalonatus (strain IBT 40285) TaxID=1283841 RepID=A0A084QSP1_STAC4|nr:hypothetical protein S40285_08386 [Stachybotrys chlorohalonata IBT 40285]